LSERTRRKGCARGCGFGCALLLALPALLWLIATLVTGANVRSEIARLRKAGDPVDGAGIRALVPHCAPGEENAAMVYQEAFARRVDPPGYNDISGVASDQWTPQQWGIARRFLSDNADYFRLLDQASRLKKCEYEADWDDMLNALFPQFAPMREGSRALNTKAELQLADGRVDDAANTCATHYRIARHAEQNPTLIGQLVAVAIRGLGNKELQRVLSQGTPSVATSRRMFSELDDPSRLQAWVNAMRAERVMGLQAFTKVEQGQGVALAALSSDPPGPSSEGYALLVYGTLGRPFLNADKQHYLDSRDKEAAELGTARIALAVKAYRGEHGAYPASLADLTTAGWKLPLDPFAGKSYRYRREGPGFAVWSTGPDLKDNNAHAVDWRHDQLGGSGYDFVFRCAK
jgi:hypothetical protein